MVKKILNVLKIKVFRVKPEECKAHLLNLQQVLGKDIVKRRDDLDLTQKQFIQFSGIPQSTVSEVESGGTNVTLATLIRYAMAYRTSVVDQLREKAFHEKL